MEDSKKCVVCGCSFEKKTNVSRKNWLKSKFCGRECMLESLGFKKKHPTWNKGKTGYISEEGRRKMADNARRNIAKETPEQRKERGKRALETRIKNGIWVPSQLGNIGYKSKLFLGDKATYNAKHRWIQKHWKKTGTCEECGKTPKPFGRCKVGTQWHNLDERYDRDSRETWREVCIPCHRVLEKR